MIPCSHCGLPLAGIVDAVDHHAHHCPRRPVTDWHYIYGHRPKDKR